MADSRTYDGNGCKVTIVDPENITRDECVSLARCGREAWENWISPLRNSSDEVKARNAADFSGIDFTNEPISFKNFSFDFGANFDGVRFGHDADFRGALFQGLISFRCTQFNRPAFFNVSLYNFDTSDILCGGDFILERV